MVASRASKIAPRDQQSLEHFSDLLHLFHHRNKNQHRRSVWWRHFSTFRRQVNHLVEEVRRLNATPTTNLAKTKKKAQDKLTQERVVQRLSFWQDFLVPKWQHAFSQTVADGRFAVLGLVLVAVLSQVCQLVGVTAAFEEIGQAEVEKVLEAFGSEHREGLSYGEREAGLAEEDFGVAIRRDVTPQPAITKVVGESAPAAISTPPATEDGPRQVASMPGKRAITTAGKPPSKKRRKKGDAIDDLFSGLG